MSKVPMKNRSRMEIIYDIVSSAKSPVKKTNLMYKSNLSFKQLELYLGFLIEQGLIEMKSEEMGPGKIYGATSKGFQFTHVFEDLQGYLTLRNPLGNAIPNRVNAREENLPTPKIQLS